MRKICRKIFDGTDSSVLRRSLMKAAANECEIPWLSSGDASRSMDLFRHCRRPHDRSQFGTTTDRSGNIRNFPTAPELQHSYKGSILFPIGYFVLA